MIVRTALWGLLAALVLASAAARPADQYPSYKPSSRSPAVDIRTNAYGASRDAPGALGIGAVVPDFEVPQAGGGLLSLSATRGDGDVVIIFYRGHW